MSLEIGKIIQGHANELLGRNSDISELRMKVCQRCPIFYNNMGGICNPHLYIHPDTEDVSVYEKPGYVKGCGCRLQAKTRLIDAKCIINKW